MKADDAPAHAMSQIYSGDEKKIYSAVFYTADTAPSREFCRIKFFRKKVQKNALVLCLYLLRLRINTAENAHKDTYCYKCSVSSFLVLVSSRCRSYARIEHSKSLFFWCIFNLHFWSNFCSNSPQNCLLQALFFHYFPTLVLLSSL